MDATTGTGAGLMGFGAGVLITAVIIWLLIGLAIGAIARFVLPGPDPMSWGKTLLFGIGGSFLGGFVGRALSIPQGFGFLLSVACAAGLIWFFTRRNKSSGPTA